MKFLTPLNPHQELTLNEMYKNALSHRVRQRAHILLMSNRFMKIDQIAKAIDLDRDTVSQVISTYEQNGLGGLFDKKRNGRPTIFTKEDEEIILSEVNKNPRQLKATMPNITKQTNKKSSMQTIKRIIKKKRLCWKRIKKKLANKPDPKEYELKKKEIENLSQRADKEEINLFFGDESGFSLVPSVPYAWQEIGENIEVPSSISTRVNVLGFLNKQNNDLKCMTVEGSINGDCVIGIIDSLFQNIEKETWIILDNASVHKNKKFELKMKEWEKKELNIFFLPTYSPELNLIEILWRFIKYQWLDFSAYESLSCLKKSLNNILSNYGSKYLINFG